MADSENTTADLPPVIPVFPLPKVILFPESNLPLNIFEPRYLKMVEDAQANHGIIGMVQPKTTDDLAGSPEVYQVGGAGRITHSTKTEDGRYLIRLTGISRFHIESELSGTTPYRQVMANWEPFQDDTMPPPPPGTFDREGLMTELKAYLDKRGLEADYDGINAAPDTVLINTLSMIIPLTIAEKQALLEANTTTERAETLKSLLMMVSISDKTN
ncbi:MAG: LON peptidase substrate-binding domain-containing protein [Kordiimonas sp.]